jgi:hypothetical protein
MMLLLVTAALGAGIWLAGPRNAKAATLTGVNGRIEVASGESADMWTLVSNGYRIKSGQRIRTGDFSTATLKFFDGSQLSLEPNTDLTFVKVDGWWGRSLQVNVQQNAGGTAHQVVPLRGSDSSYVVYTPAGSAVVH